MENSPPHTKRAPKRLNLRNWKKNRPEFWRRPFFFFFGDHLILGRKNVWILDFGRKITLNFGEDLFFFFFFFGDHLILGGKNFEFPIFPRHFVSNFGQTVWNWFKVNENSSQGRLHTSHSFKIAPPFPNPGYAPAWVSNLILLSSKVFSCMGLWDGIHMVKNLEQQF